MNLAATLPDLLRLTRDDKLRLIDALEVSLAEEDDAHVDDSTKQLLDERWSQHIAKPEEALSVNEFKKLYAVRRSCVR
jgi:putative addiction module component (TIGR02574 family)